MQPKSLKICLVKLQWELAAIHGFFCCMKPGLCNGIIIEVFVYCKHSLLPIQYCFSLTMYEVYCPRGCKRFWMPIVRRAKTVWDWNIGKQRYTKSDTKPEQLVSKEENIFCWGKNLENDALIWRSVSRKSLYRDTVDARQTISHGANWPVVGGWDLELRTSISFSDNALPIQIRWLCKIASIKWPNPNDFRSSLSCEKCIAFSLGPISCKVQFPPIHPQC